MYSGYDVLHEALIENMLQKDTFVLQKEEIYKWSSPYSFSSIDYTA